MEGVSVAAVPPPRPAEESAAEPPSRGSGRRSLAVALLLGAAGAALVLLAAGKTWSTGTAPSAGSVIPVTATGKAVTGLPDALALVGLAALVAVFAVRRVGRLVVSALLALCGAGTVAACVTGAADTKALNAAAAKASGLTGTAVQHVGHTGWPWVAAVGGLLLLLAGALAIVRGAAWPTMSSRYERAGGPRPQRAARRAPDPEQPGEMWKALDRGEDPTAD
ncbi:TIGR02234 family membrane protein [Streptantibioticus ferralitis]|uniref:TIGR02234 family membrane protein n=1 Tax=Streptantibioticus ferralitis TaxID=236510 RepID=A0ABT5Z1U9_9ACTN|nr:TIGR02234 family membrane protein [Streptantibioticus ferralitis]MDF2257025.1 TIGR02234 family membrane protein [Streptantibioticus ferralitis]